MVGIPGGGMVVALPCGLTILNTPCEYRFYSHERESYPRVCGLRGHLLYLALSLLPNPPLEEDQE